ncbi:unnamed protein product [Pleuronectes platessa]|uniref:DUF4200 domain-containing protein n=1 Tax=Pleuronectes platessa TaxID=8262 RepID=A0A9N7VZF6_PLEPL|nr:unnamed protein product [Pleuronectes platessa]
MEASSLPFLDNRDPRLKLKVENRIRNVFVTQTDDTRHVEEKDVNPIPVVTQVPGRVLEAGVNTLQKTVVLKKQAELDEVNALLALKRQEFRTSVEALSQRKSELDLKLQETKERAMKFERFVAENEVKRCRSLKKYEAARAAEHFEAERNRGSNEAAETTSHQTLSVTNQQLMLHLGRLEEEVEEGQRRLHTMEQEHGIKKLMANKELSELQTELEMLKEKNEQAEVNLLMVQGLSTEKVEEVGSLLMAVHNLAEQCYLPTYGPLENMNEPTKMDMVKEYILDKADTERRARRLMESGSAMTGQGGFDRQKRAGFNEKHRQ